MDAQATPSYFFPQSDLNTPGDWHSVPQRPAQKLLPHERQELAVQVLAGAQPVSDMAREHDVSRKFLYQQAHTAQDALTQAFAPEPKTGLSSSTCL
jgi:transposase-like protein